jgi:hypothetical protein
VSTTYASATRAFPETVQFLVDARYTAHPLLNPLHNGQRSLAPTSRFEVLADKCKNRLDTVIRKPIDQSMQLFTHRAHARSLRLARLVSLAICAGRGRPVAVAVACPFAERSTEAQGDSRSLDRHAQVGVSPVQPM